MSRQTLGRRITNEMADMKKRLKDMLRKVPNVCTTADVWTGGRRAFMGVTVHWVRKCALLLAPSLVCYLIQTTCLTGAVQSAGTLRSLATE